MTKYFGLLTLGLCIQASPSQAAGFFIQEQSVSAGGAAYAGAATRIDDASTLFFNPAGMAGLDAAQAHIGVQLLIPSANLDDTGSTSTTVTGIALPGLTPATATAPVSGGDGGNPYDPTIVPSAYLAFPLTGAKDLWFGVGISNPFGLANRYDADYFARFDSVKTDLSVTDIQPSLAYKVNDRLSLGGGVNFAFADAELTAAVSNGVSEGISNLKGNDWGYGYTLGAQFKPAPRTTLGLNYRSSLHFDLDGSARVEGLGGVFPLTLGGVPTGLTTPAPAPNGVTDAKASLATPDIASFGIAQGLNARWTLLAQANWFGWNNFDNITAVSDDGDTLSRINQNYQTVWSYALGAEYAASNDLVFRVGFQYDNTPTTDEYRTTRTPDGDRTWLSTGLTYKLNEDLSFDALATYIHIQGERIDVMRGTDPAIQDIEADTAGSVGIVALGLNYKF